MTPQQFKQFLEDNRESTARAIKETVNGKIDALRAQHEKDMAEIKPFLQGFAGVQIVWKGLLAVGSLALAWAAIKNFKL